MLVELKHNTGVETNQAQTRFVREGAHLYSMQIPILVILTTASHVIVES